MIIFDDIEMLLPSLLRESFTDAYVGRNVPDPLREQVITVRRQGGYRVNRFTESVNVGINIYAVNDKDANDLALEVRASIEGLVDHGPIKRVRTEGITEIPSDTNNKRRYFAVRIDLRGTAYDAGKEI